MPDYTNLLQTDDDIARLFDKMIAPEMPSLEKQRLAAVAEKWRRWLLGGAGVAAIVLAIFLLCRANEWGWWIPIIPLVIGAFGIWIWADIATGDYEGRLRKCFMSAICNTMGDLYHVNDIHDDTEDAFEEFDFQPFRDAHLIPNFDDFEFGDLLRGRHKDCDFVLVKTTLTSQTRNSKGGTTTQTDFNGLLFQLEVPDIVDGKVIIMRDYGTWLNKVRGWWRDGVRVEIPHAEFESKYEVHASSEGIALKLITPAFVENFLRLPEIFGSDKLRAAFIGPMFFVSADGVSSFMDGFSANTTPDKLKPLFEDIVKDVKLAHRVIEQLHKG